MMTKMNSPDCLQEDFDRFDRAHPGVYRLFKAKAEELRDRGQKRLSSKYIVERIRSECPTSTSGEDFKINNNYTPYLVRKLIAERPDFAGYFELRKISS